jgi:hypothetical protein
MIVVPAIFIVAALVCFAIAATDDNSGIGVFCGFFFLAIAAITGAFL